ncbi:MAG: ATP-binding cassette domain-containing protein, partial [Bacteroidia bacterium]|nr:ATP-binding cassette domain-containing protein [Bacteroidia bacterium]
MEERIVLSAENISKMYRLGLVNSRSLTADLNRWWHRLRGKEDPYLKIGETNDRTKKGKSDLVWALRDINFDVKQGEVLGIIGKNGAGKSTLLKILSRVTSPTVGEIKVKGRIASLLEVGTGFHPELTGRENIFLNGAIMGMSKQEISSKFDEIVDFSGVERYIDTPVKRYSSGMYVRLAFAVAAHLEPEILIVDEVLAVGDAEFQKKCMGKMKDVSGAGRTVLFVSHQMSSIRSLCTKGVMLNRGGIEYIGNTDDCVSLYLGSQDNSGTDLINRTDRLGAGQVRFTNIHIYNSSGDAKVEFFSGDAITIKLNYQINKEFNIREFLFSLVFFDTQERIMAAFPSDELNKVFDFNFEKKIG